MKNIRHNNIMSWKNRGEQYVEIICRGCSMRGRERIWIGYTSSMADELNRGIDNSYFVFEEEPGNSYDPNAIQVVCRGEFFGTAGYVGKEYTGTVKEILEKCEVYRIDMKDEAEAGEREIRLLVYWA